MGEPMGAGKDDYEDVAYFWFIPLTNNVKSLFVMMILFAIITIAQYFAAVAAHSMSLKADCVSMGVDALSYLGNIFGESAKVKEQRIVLQLFFSMLSLCLLVGFNTQILMEVNEILFGEAEEEEEDVVAWIVLLFAGFGLLFDFASLGSYWYHAKKEAELQFEKNKAKAIEEGQGTAKVEKPHVNMLTALLHVGADLLRSTTTFIEGLVLLGKKGAEENNSAFIDGVCGFIICLTVYIGAAYALYEWVQEFWTWFSALGEPLPEAKKVEEPTKE